MLHNITELYNIRGQIGLYEFDVIKHLPYTAVSRARAMPRGKEVKVYQVDGSYKTAYLYGEKTWSYDEKEIENHRKASQEQKERARLKKELTNKILDICAKMSIEELAKFAERIDKV